MPTNSIGRNKCNVSLSMPDEASLFWGQLAFGDDRSKGSFIQRMALEGLRLKNPLAAANLEKIWRQHRQKVAGMTCLLLACLTVFGGSEQLRARSCRRSRREDAIEVRLEKGVAA